MTEQSESKVGGEIVWVLGALAVMTLVIGLQTSATVAIWWIGLLIGSFVGQALLEGYRFNFTDSQFMYDLIDTLRAICKFVCFAMAGLGALVMLHTAWIAIGGGRASSASYEDVEYNHY